MTRLEGKPGPSPLSMPPGWPIEEYCRHLLINERQGRGTVRERRLQLARFGRSHPDPWSVDRDDVAIYLLPAKPEYAKNIKAGLHGFYAWAAASRRSTIDPTLGIRVKVPKAEPRPCPDEVWQDIQRRLMVSGDPRERATGLMIGLAGLMGLRRAEIAHTHPRDVEGGSSLRVVGKGGVARSVVLPPSIKAAILAAPAGWLFPGADPGQPITPDAAGRRISRALPPGWTAHTLRHRFATVAYERTNHDLLRVQRMMGHSSPVTTERYIKSSTADDALLAELMDQ
jgi:integrase